MYANGFVLSDSKHNLCMDLVQGLETSASARLTVGWSEPFAAEAVKLLSLAGLSEHGALTLSCWQLPS